jgi:hypothetical protein
MNRRVSTAFLIVVAALALPASIAAATPQLSATTIAGKEIDVTGSGFPADADVLLVVERNGADDGSQTLHSDATGSFSTSIDAGPGRGGAYTLVATAGSAKAVLDIVAVETAGGGTSGGTRPTAPATDTAPTPASHHPADDTGRLAILGLVLLGATVLTARRFTPSAAARAAVIGRPERP